jgi:hypothetical protein
MMARFAILVVCVMMLPGCTFVKVTPAGEQVKVSTATAVESCERIGKTKTRVRSKIWIFKRSEEKVTRELADLARDDAAEMGGTDVAPLAEAADGQQSFGIYRCSARQGPSTGRSPGASRGERGRAASGSRPGRAAAGSRV